MREGPLEITDLLWHAEDGIRSPVRQADVVRLLRERGQRRAARIVAALPSSGGDLDQDAVDALGLRVHRELSRLGEELQLAHRVAATVEQLIARRGLAERPVRLLDVGCGLGHVLRTIAVHRLLPAHVELVGADLNPVLIAEAEHLAAREAPGVRFAAVDAFEPGTLVTDGSETVVVSTGVLHHVAPEELATFFSAHTALGVAAFAHWDIAPCRWSTLGAWVFHRARMREAVSRHDGVLSARRAHAGATLLRAAVEGADGYDITVDEGGRWHPRALDVLRPIVGIRR